MSSITWFGHSAFKIGCPDVQVVIDPFFAPPTDVNAATLGPVDLVLVTHDHSDHVGEAVEVCRRSGAMLGAIVGTAGKLVAAGVPQAQILNGIGFNMGGTVSHRGVNVTMTQAYPSSDSGAPAGYIVRMPDGLTVYHAGDTCVFSGMELWGRLYSIDVALLPVGGVFTMDARQAALACKLLGCKAVIPMHWGTFPVLAQNTAAFKEALQKQHLSCTCVDMGVGETVSFG